MSEMVRTVRKTYQEQQEQLRPTPAQQREREEVVLWRCRTRDNPARQPCPTTLPDNPARQQRITLWKQRGVSISRYQQEAELKALRADLPDYAGLRRTTPDYAALHSQVLQDVLARLDTPYHKPSSARLPPVFRPSSAGWPMAWRAARVPPLAGEGPRSRLHRQGVWQRCPPG